MKLYLIIVETWNGTYVAYSDTLAFLSEEERDKCYAEMEESKRVEDADDFIRKDETELTIGQVPDIEKTINKALKGWYDDYDDGGRRLVSPDGHAVKAEVEDVARFFYKLGKETQS